MVDVSSVGPFVRANICSNEGLTLETWAIVSSHSVSLARSTFSWQPSFSAHADAVHQVLLRASYTLPVSVRRRPDWPVHAFGCRRGLVELRQPDLLFAVLRGGRVWTTRHALHGLCTELAAFIRHPVQHVLLRYYQCAVKFGAWNVSVLVSGCNTSCTSEKDALSRFCSTVPVTLLQYGSCHAFAVRFLSRFCSTVPVTLLQYGSCHALRYNSFCILCNGFCHAFRAVSVTHLCHKLTSLPSRSML